MIPMASVLIASLVVAAVELVGCSSDNTATTTNTPFDSGTVTVPEGGATPSAVAISVAGKGVVVSADGVPATSGPNGYAGADGGSPIVDCIAPNSGACSAPQGIVIYAVPNPGNAFAGWSVIADGGAAVISADTNISIEPGIGSPLTATFVSASPSSPSDAGGGG
jgi:hypothetical protein